MLHPNHQSENYLGVTGFTSRGQIESLTVTGSNASANKDLNSGILNPATILNGPDTYPWCYIVMAGVLLSDKTFHGIRNKQPKRYPEVASIPFIWHPKAFNVLHYCTENPALPEIDAVMEACGICPGMGIQFNVAWPDIKVLSHVRSLGISTIIQMNNTVFRSVDGVASKFLAAVAPYYSIADYVLFDMSGGHGIQTDAEMLLRYIAPLHEKFPKWNLAVAGGLGPNCSDVLMPLHSVKEVLSVDAESRLRDANDCLDITRCKLYLQSASRIFARKLLTNQPLQYYTGKPLPFDEISQSLILTVKPENPPFV